MTALSILAVDDEEPALDELAYLLDDCEGVGPVVTVRTADEALRQLRDTQFDLLLLDICMPGFDGLELAGVLGRFVTPPTVVFVTAHDEHALQAFDVGAAGYLLKPIDKERLERVLDRILSYRRERSEALDAVAVESNGTTRLVERSEVRWVESAGDYVRLHLRDGTGHLLRVPMAALEEQWAEHGFARVHRGALVALREVRELRSDGAGTALLVGDDLVPVSRRHVRDLRERLVRPERRNR